MNSLCNLVDKLSKGGAYLSGFLLFSSDSHIRINIITSKLSKKANKKVDVFAAIIALGVLFFAFYRTVLLAYDSYEFEMLSENVSETPIYLTQLAMPIGIALFIIDVNRNNWNAFI
jgi:TRAP-type mannitol/chloroaromatic compound transport system permease small subunit